MISPGTSSRAKSGANSENFIESRSLSSNGNKWSALIPGPPSAGSPLWRTSSPSDPSARPPKISRCFFLPTPMFAFFFLTGVFSCLFPSLGVFSWNCWWCLKDPHMCTLGLSGSRVQPPAAPPFGPTFSCFWASTPLGNAGNAGIYLVQAPSEFCEFICHFFHFVILSIFCFFDVFVFCVFFVFFFVSFHFYFSFLLAFLFIFLFRGSSHSGRSMVTRVTVGRDIHQSFRVCKVNCSTSQSQQDKVNKLSERFQRFPES